MGEDIFVLLIGFHKSEPTKIRSMEIITPRKFNKKEIAKKNKQTNPRKLNQKQTYLECKWKRRRKNYYPCTQGSKQSMVHAQFSLGTNQSVGLRMKKI